MIVGIENSSALKAQPYSAAMKIARAYREKRWEGAQASILAVAYWFARVLVSAEC